MTNEIKPPVAKIVPTVLEEHGNKRVDNYFWMNQREDQNVVDYLNAENNYYQQMTAHTKELQADLFTEMKSRIKEDDTSVPYFYKSYELFEQSSNTGGLIRWPVKLLIPVGFGLLILAGISHLIKSIGFLLGVCPDPIAQAEALQKAAL